MKKILLIGIVASLFTLSVKAQVSDVSITVTPQIGYNWFDNKSTVDNGTMYGLQAGFGFGKVIELRGVWERSLDLKQNFGKYQSDIQQLFPSFNFENRAVKVTRYGGEFKTNLPIGGFAPYLILGTGIQEFKTTTTAGVNYKNENLYGSGGLGFKISLGDRLTLNLEGRGLVYNMNPNSLLYNEGGSSQFDDYINNTNQSQMYNWSVMAGLQLYLGGRSNDDMDALDRAYLNRFSGGLSGTKLTLSPAGSYVKFNSNSAYRDTYMLGGIAGIDFSNYAGLQGYYYRATNDEKIQLDFDQLEMFGADFVGKLNVPRGIVPYISVGGGYLNVKDNYQGKPIMNNGGVVTGLMTAKSGYFAKGGVGVSIPLSKYINVFGSANLMYTMQNKSAKVADLQSANQLYQNTMYTTGVRLNLGTSANTDKATNKAFDRKFSDERSEYDARIAALEQDLDESNKNTDNNRKSISEKNEYDARITALEQQLKEAYKNNDTEKLMSVMKEKKTVDSINRSSSTKSGLIRMTPAELEKLIQKVLDGVNKDSQLTVEDRLERIEQMLMMSNQGQPIVVGMDRLPVQASQQTTNDELLIELKKLKVELEEQKRNNIVQPTKETTVILQNSNDSDANNNSTPKVTTTTFDPNISHLPVGYTPYIGFNFGDMTSFNVGLRRYYAFESTKIMFAPEAYLAIGNKLGFGVSANGVLPFKTNVNGLTPYGGLGLGAHYLGSDFRFATNILGGVAYQLGKGKLTADYTIRGAFRNNQLAVGYRFSL